MKTYAHTHCTAGLALALLAAIVPGQRPASPLGSTKVLSPVRTPTADAASRARDAFDLGAVTEADAGRPLLIVLLHGGTPSPQDNPIPGVPEPTSATLDYTRFYWGYDFVRRLMGVSRSVGLKTLSGVVLNSASWSRHDSPDRNGKVRYTEGARENVLDDRFVVPGSHTGNGVPKIAALLTFRDGSRSLMEQSQAAIDQIHDAYRQKFGSAANPGAGPNLILVGHSMGNLVSRVILTAPVEPIQGARLSDDQRAKAQALRDRTLYLISLAGPHEGSPLAERATLLLDTLHQVPQPLVAVLDAIAGGIGSGAVRWAEQQFGKPEIRDLQTSVWAQLNAGVLAPQRAQRADGTLVPVYTLIGHSPAGDFYTDPLAADQYPGGGIGASDLGDEERRRGAVRSLALMLVDYLLHNLNGNGPKGWGSTRDAAFDRVARYHRKALGLTLSAPGEDEGLPLGFPQFYSRERVTREERPLFGEPRQVVVRTNRDGEVDSDGLVGVTSGHGNRLGTRTDGFFDHTREWPVGSDRLFGSWYRLSSDGTPWEFANHERIHRLQGAGNWLHANLIAQAGPYVSLDPDDEISVWSRPLTSEELRDRAKAAVIAKIKKKMAIARAKAKVRQRIEGESGDN